MGQNTIIYVWRYKYMHYKMFKKTMGYLLEMLLTYLLVFH